MKAEAQKEHVWLAQLIGNWECEHSAVMKPGEAPTKFVGQETVRAVGDLWVLAEGHGETPGGATAATVMTLGFDPGKGRFVGTFIASMMTELWLYDGELDASGKVLTLDTEGPAMDGKGRTKYKDVIEIRNPNHRLLTSSALGADGTWNEFMRADYHRVK